MDYAELRQKYEQLKAEGKELSTSKSLAKVYNQLKNHPIYQLVKTLENEIVRLDEQLDELDKMGLLSLSDEERATFLQNAIDQVQPYYDSKRSEIEAGLAEGGMRTAEDILSTIRNVEFETEQLLQNFDLSTAETEEQFIDRMSALTSRTEDDLAMKKDDWRQRLESTKMDQVQRGMFSSGVGGEQRQQLEDRKKLELEAVQRRAGEQQTELERNKKYDLESISLARQAAEERRVQQIGTPQEREALQQRNLGALGYEDMSQLPSQASILERQKTSGVTPLYDQTHLTDLDRERAEATERRKLELQQQATTEKSVEYEQQRKKILAQQAQKAAELGRYY